MPGQDRVRGARLGSNSDAMLTYNDHNNTFLLTTNDAARAESAGLTLSNSIRGPSGERVYFTADYEQRPEYNPYAALPFWREADDKARAKLGGLVADYEASWAQDSSFQPPAPEGQEYMPFQRAGIEYASRRDRVVIGDEPGLGKTVQGVGLANHHGFTRVLVVCPASVRINWQREVHIWSTIPNVTTYAVRKSSDGVSPLANYVICSYSLASSKAIHEALCAMDWDLLILDEIHYLKNSDTQRSWSVFGGGAAGGRFSLDWLADRARCVLGLSGTLLPNRPRECYTVTRALDWEAIDWMSWDAFTFRFNPSIRTFSGHNLEERGRLFELQARLRTNILVRRLKRDVLRQLPDKRYEMTYVEPNGAIREILAKEALIDFYPEDLLNPDFELDGTPISTLRREMGEAKAPRVVEYVKYLLDVVDVPKLVIFAHHRSVMDMLAEALSRYGVCVHRGGMSDRAKEESRLLFVNGKPRIWMGQLDSVEGIDGLQGVASHVVLAEPAWRPSTNEQCVDRCHRIGQHDNVIAQFLIAEGSFDEKVLNAVLGKARDIHETLDRRF